MLNNCSGKYLKVFSNNIWIVFSIYKWTENISSLKFLYISSISYVLIKNYRRTDKTSLCSIQFNLIVQFKKYWLYWRVTTTRRGLIHYVFVWVLISHVTASDWLLEPVKCWLVQWLCDLFGFETSFWKPVWIWSARWCSPNCGFFIIMLVTLFWWI